MTTINPQLGRLLAGAGGVLLIASLFMTWTGGADGWEALAATDVLLVLVGLHGIAAAFTGGRHGYFRPDLSLNATADITAVFTAVVVGWWIAADAPDGAGAGSWLALAALFFAAGFGRVVFLPPAAATSSASASVMKPPTASMSGIAS